MERRTFLAASAAGLAGAAGCLRSRAGGDYDVGMTAKRFRPEALEVAVGETVVWKNTSSRAHSVTAYEDRIPEGAAFFASGGYDGEQAARDAWLESGGGTIHGGEIYRHAFAVAGTFHYFCIPHEPGGMVGRIVVSE